MPSQIDRWRGEFGTAYIERNEATEQNVQASARSWGRQLVHMPDLRSALEVGANIGVNLRALQRMLEVELWAVEPNEAARARLVDDGVVAPERALAGDLSRLPLDDGAVDLVFTRGVLIHVPDSHIETAYREMYRVTRRWLLFSEYFAPTATPISYRGHDDMLWKRDYGAIALDLFDDLRYVADGFLWSRVTGLDNLNWWLFEKDAS